ncbi:hypothetical protein GCM10025777_12770 [Membranihabitans marinus]
MQSRLAYCGIFHRIKGAITTEPVAKNLSKYGAITPEHSGLPTHDTVVVVKFLKIYGAITPEPA